MLPSHPQPARLGELSRDERRRFTAAMFARAADTVDDTDRRRILHDVILANIGVASTIASRYRSRGIPIEDLQQVASAALVRAVHRFDLSLATDFLAYAVPSIRGEIRRYFRDNGWMVRPPRRIQELQSKVFEMRDRLGAEPGAAGEHAIAEALDVPVDDVAEALAAEGCFAPSSLDAPLLDDQSMSLGDAMADPRSSAAREAAEARVMLHPVVRLLSARDQALLRLRFTDERTQQEIGEEFGVTQTQVSRMLTRVLGELKDSLTPAVTAH